jgi:hypothetical protein
VVWHVCRRSRTIKRIVNRVNRVEDGPRIRCRERLMITIEMCLFQGMQKIFLN